MVHHWLRQCILEWSCPSLQMTPPGKVVALQGVVSDGPLGCVASWRTLVVHSLLPRGWHARCLQGLSSLYDVSKMPSSEQSPLHIGKTRLSYASVRASNFPRTSRRPAQYFLRMCAGFFYRVHSMTCRVASGDAVGEAKNPPGPTR